MQLPSEGGGGGPISQIFLAQLLPVGGMWGTQLGLALGTSTPGQGRRLQSLCARVRRKGN